MTDAPHPDVYLLGAGFARAISSKMPLLQDLATRLLDRRGRAVRLPNEVEAMMRENFAHALSYLEEAKPWITEADNLRHRALFLEFSIAIAHDLDATVTEVGRELEKSVPGWMTALIRHFLRTTCGDRAEITVVDRADTARRNFQRLFGGTRVRITPRSTTSASIERFVRAL